MSKQSATQERIWIGRPTWERLRRFARKHNTVAWKLATAWLRERLDVEAAERKAKKE